MKSNNKALEANKTKEESVYIRVDSRTLEKIKKLQSKHKHKTRSHTIRALISWAFDNGVESVAK